MVTAVDLQKAQLRSQIETSCAAFNLSFQEAADQIKGFARVDLFPLIDGVVADLGKEAELIKLLDDPVGSVADDVHLAAWYTGPGLHDKRWNQLREKMLAGSAAHVVESVDKASTKVVAQLANPAIHGNKVQGLVLGHVQAGKTANYTAVAAKAADRGYRLVIVMAGIHNNLRDQTQARLHDDLGDAGWTFLTSDSLDFEGRPDGTAMLSHSGGPRIVIVIKKNHKRLEILKDWLARKGAHLLRTVPILLIDDEADQATPNSATKRDEQTKINQLVTEIWQLVQTGCYVGYTATPFANIFMDPNDDKQLYPRHFIVELPRSDAYFGAEEIFGRDSLGDDDTPDDGLDMVRNIPEEEAQSLRPARAEIEGYRADIPASLAEAVRWFILSSAVRRARGQRKHSSMLVHTTHNVDPHFAIAHALQEVLGDFGSEVLEHVFRPTYEREIDRVRVGGHVRLSWDEVEPRVMEILDEVRVVVDNGMSVDRLNYRRVDADGRQMVETVIAVGGGTLSRGLTLEGLVVSYFARTSSTYDSLLQMGRWFGYRNGYEDLPRIYVTSDVEDDFRFLALVEEEMRQEIRSMARQHLTPNDIGVRIRQHPGRLAITSAGKIRNADVVQLSYNGQRLQTFIFDEKDERVQRTNLTVARALLTPLQQGYEVNRGHVYTGVNQEAIVTFLRTHRVHPAQNSIDVRLIEQWLGQTHPDAEWNVVVASNTAKWAKKVEIKPGMSVGAFERSPLAKDTNSANLKAVLSDPDWCADVTDQELATLAGLPGSGREKRRRSSLSGTGTLILMVIDKDSRPSLQAEKLGSRRPLLAPQHLVAYGLIFPYDPALPEKDSGYIAVEPALSMTVAEDQDEESYEEGEI